jgi:hypothetical protein
MLKPALSTPKRSFRLWSLNDCFVPEAEIPYAPSSHDFPSCAVRCPQLITLKKFKLPNKRDGLGKNHI